MDFCKCGQELKTGLYGKTFCPACAAIEQAAREVAEQEAARLRQLREGIPAKYHDADFDRCDDRLKAVAAVKKWVAEPDGIILIHGKCGRGKTFLAAAAKKEFNRTRRPCRMVSEDEILLAIKSSFGKNAEITEREAYRKFTDAAPLIIDDLGIARVSEFTFDVWENIIGRRYREDSPTLITSNYGIDKLSECVGVRIADRIREYKNILEYIGENRRRGC